MLHTLYDINLQQLSAELLEGHWQVVSRVLPRTGTPEVHLMDATTVELAGAALRIADGQTPEYRTGQWQLLTTAGFNRPYLALELPAGPARALITRLRRSPDGTQGRLELYFQSGLELELQRPA